MIIKTITANDIGKTGGHQAGIHIPKKEKLLNFFPALPPKIKNPRTTIHFKDEAGQTWAFNYIYYNNKLFGGTRDEFRLTGMTEFIRSRGLKEGDKLAFEKIDSEYRISKVKEDNMVNREGVLKLSNNWITINI